MTSYQMEMEAQAAGVVTLVVQLVPTLEELWITTNRITPGGHAAANLTLKLCLMKMTHFAWRKQVI